MGATLGSADTPFADGPRDAQPALRDAVASASYDYDEALMDYEAVLGSRDADKRAAIETRLQEATRRLSAAQAALVASRTRPTRSLTFDDLLRDPTQQLDLTGSVMASVLAYRSASHSTASASPEWLDRAPQAAKAAQYVHDRITASTVVATAS